MNPLITVIHRVCPALSKTAVGFTDKRSMIEAAAETMAAALTDINAKIFVILDGCPDYRTIFTTAFNGKDTEFIETQSIGNKATWAKQVGIALNCNTPYVYFSEDDYLYKSNAFAAMLEAISIPGISMVSPIDHPDRYSGKCETPVPVDIFVTDSRHWRTCNSTCLTFLAKKEVIEKSYDILLRYAAIGEEGTMWIGLTKERVFDFPYLLKTFFRFAIGKPVTFGQLMPVCAWKQLGFKLLTHPRYRLASPIPTLATHLSSASLSPCVEYSFEK